MLNDYKMNGPTKKISVEVEAPTLEVLEKMAAYKKLTISEMTNTALARFVRAHKDFLPPHEREFRINTSSGKTTFIDDDDKSN